MKRKFHLFGVYLRNENNPVRDDGMGLVIAVNHVQAKSVVYNERLKWEVAYKDLYARKVTPEQCGDDPESGTSVWDMKAALENAKEPEIV